MPTRPALHDASTLARDEEYWQRIAAGYEVEPGPINFEYGYFGRMTRTVVQQYQQHIAFINRSNSLHARQQFEEEVEDQCERFVLTNHPRDESLVALDRIVDRGDVLARLVEARHPRRGDAFARGDGRDRRVAARSRSAKAGARSIVLR